MAELPPVSVLTIAGSDSSGGAGIQADLKTIAAHRCHGTSAITALTAQNTTGVQEVHPIPPEFIAKQIHSILDDIEPFSIKTGMMHDAEVVHAVVKALRTHYTDNSSLPPLVCDPVCVSTSGHSLLDPKAIQVLINEIFPLAKLITPNKSEAELLLSHRQMPSQISSVKDMIQAAQDLLQFGSHAVLLKGGHIVVSTDDVEVLAFHNPSIEVISYGLFGKNMEILQVDQDEGVFSQVVVDVLCEDGKITLFVRPRIDTTSTHGTGCTLSAAIASQLAGGLELKEAIKRGVVYTFSGIETALAIGKGHGPLNHFHAMELRSVPRPTKTNRHPLTRLLIEGHAETWRAYIQHRFVELLGEGTLPKKAFVHFIVQDYHYLKYYARAHGLLAAKSTSFESIASATQTIMNIITELATHKSFCSSFGITEEELEKTPEDPATTAYGTYLIDIGLQGDATKLLMALLACLLGYGEVGLWLKTQTTRPHSRVVFDGNPYKRWMESYSGERFQGAVKLGLELIESKAAADPPSPVRFKEWKQVWEKCTILESAFWDAAMTAGT